jgi:hypothetical protein
LHPADAGGAAMTIYEAVMVWLITNELFVLSMIKVKS